MTTQFDLNGKVVMVTGGGTGIGKHLALSMAQAGADVIVTGRRKEKLEQTVEAIKAIGKLAKAVSMDITSAESITSAFSNLQNDFSSIDALFNNAGVSVPKTLIDTETEEWDNIFATNTRGPWLCGKAYLEYIRAQNQTRGSIINVGSITGIGVQKGLGAYATSKAAVIHLTEIMAAEWARYGVRANALLPGYFNTDITEDFLASDAGKAMIKRISMRRLGELPELEGPAQLLASEASSYMNGSVLVVDGGHLLRTL